jgi:mono/diheme cytochrome c family protein
MMGLNDAEAGQTVQLGRSSAAKAILTFFVPPQIQAMMGFLPKGDLKIARQFTAGATFAVAFVPKGRLKTISNTKGGCYGSHSVVPSGLNMPSPDAPTLERVGYSRFSLRERISEIFKFAYKFHVASRSAWCQDGSQPRVWKQKNRSLNALLPASILRIAPIFFTIFFLCAGCRKGMMDQEHLKPLAESAFFSDGAGSRPIPAHTIARGHLNEDERFFTGMSGNLLVDTLPVPLTSELLARGRERFDIYCSVCHGRSGTGEGMIVLRGFLRPPSFHDPRLRSAPGGHFYDVITQGYGVMYSYASRIEPADRWAIVAYIRALQLSQNTALTDLTPAEREKLRAIRP